MAGRHRSQVAGRHHLHRRRRVVDHGSRMDERCEDDRLRARRRREPAGRIAQPGAAAGWDRSGGVRGSRSRAAPRGASGRAMAPRRRRAASASRGCRADRSGASISPTTDGRRRSSSTRAAAHRVCRGRRTARCSRSTAAAARTATSACSRWRRRNCATSIRRSIATATPVWSPDGIAHRVDPPGRGAAARMFSPRRTVDEPWSLRVADVKTGRRAGVEGRCRLRQRVPGRRRRQPAALGRRRSSGLPVGEGRLAAPLLGAGQRRHGHAADAGRVRSRVREHRARPARG